MSQDRLVVTMVVDPAECARHSLWRDRAIRLRLLLKSQAAEIIGGHADENSVDALDPMYPYAAPCLAYPVDLTAGVIHIDERHRLRPRQHRRRPRRWPSPSPWVNRRSVLGEQIVQPRGLGQAEDRDRTRSRRTFG